MLKKVILYSLLFIFALIVFLISTMPANVLWQRALAPQLPLKQMAIKVLGVEGSIWDGKVHLSYLGIESIAGWELGLSDVLSVKLPLQVNVLSHAGTLDAEISVGLNLVELNVFSADIDLASVNPALKRQRVKLDGNVFVKELQVQLKEQKIASLSGIASWTGGVISYPVGRRSTEAEMPPFKASVKTVADGDMLLSIRDSESSRDSIYGQLSKEGEAILQVTRRVLDLAGQNSPHKNEEDVVFKVKKKLY